MIHGYCNCSSNGCSCDWSSSYHNQSNSFSMLFPSMSYYHQPIDEVDYMNHPTKYSSSPVDCTLSLGTPSTRLGDDDNDRVSHDRRGKQTSKTNHHGSRNSSSSSSDGFFERRCANCDTTSTPLWRNGPNGPKSLCNACGIRFKKEKRRAAAAAAATNNNTGGATSGTTDNNTSQQMYYGIPNNSWEHQHYSQTQEIPYLFPSVGNEYRFIEEDGRDSDNGISFLSWRRPSLVHDFIR